MTPERYIILALLIAVAVLSWIAFAPSPDVPTVDPERYRIEERLKALQADYETLQCELDSALAAVDTVEVERVRYIARRDSVAVVRMGQSDSVHAVVLKRRLR